MREIDLQAPGFGHAIAAILASRHKAQMCLGGSAGLAKALANDIQEHGGEIRTGVQLKTILTGRGRAIGVELADGERIAAGSFVASGLNPQQTFLDLLDADAAERSVREAAAGFRYNQIAPLFSLNLVLREPPRYAAAERRPELNRAFMVILGLERMDQFHEMAAAHERGEIPSPILWGACPTLFDPGQAPAGRHTAFMWQKLPYALHGDAKNWDAEQAEQGRAMLALWSRFAPNLAEAGTVLDAFTRSPLDTERSLPNMCAGDLLVGSLSYGQVGFHRPFPGAGQYRTPVGGLYLCGGSTHPGGNITGLCGYNAAAVLAADLGLHAWWNPPQAERPGQFDEAPDLQHSVAATNDETDREDPTRPRWAAQASAPTRDVDLDWAGALDLPFHDQSAVPGYHVNGHSVGREHEWDQVTVFIEHSGKAVRGYVRMAGLGIDLDGNNFQAKSAISLSAREVNKTDHPVLSQSDVGNPSGHGDAA